MKASVNFNKVSPTEFAKARETIHFVKKIQTSKSIEFRNHLSYNAKNPKNYSLGSE